MRVRRGRGAHAVAGGLISLLALLCACGNGADASPAPGDGAATSPATPAAPGAAPPRWRPAVSDTWQLQLSGTIRTTHPAMVYDIDLFDAPPDTLALLRAAGKRVVCYFSAGSAEDWRADHAGFSPADIGKPLDGWPGERWLDTRSPRVRSVMQARLDLAARRGCDAVDPDNVDGHTHDTGFALTAADQRDYGRFLADQAHARGLAIGLKNAVELIDALQPHFDFAVNEQCFEYRECAAYGAFVSNGKPVFNVEYEARLRDNTAGARDALCAAARAAGIRSLVLPLALDDSFRHACD